MIVNPRQFSLNLNLHKKAGSTLLYEEPVAAFLEPSRRGTHCSHCFRLILANIPCVWCSSVNFCSIR